MLPCQFILSLSQTLPNPLSEVSASAWWGFLSTSPSTCDMWGLIKALVLKLYSKFLLIQPLSFLSSLLCEGRTRARNKSSLLCYLHILASDNQAREWKKRLLC